MSVSPDGLKVDYSGCNRGTSGGVLIDGASSRIAPIVASVAVKGGGLIEEVKRLPGVVLREVTARNRDRLPSEVIQWVNEQLMHSDAERS